MLHIAFSIFFYKKYFNFIFKTCHMLYMLITVLVGFYNIIVLVWNAFILVLPLSWRFEFQKWAVSGWVRIALHPNSKILAPGPFHKYIKTYIM